MKKRLLFNFTAVLCVLLVVAAGNVFPLGNTLEALENGLSKCRTYDDYEKYAEEIKEKMAEDPAAVDIGVLYYIIAKIRVEQLALLAKKNDVESVRLYMKVENIYYNQALTYLEDASRVATSKEFNLDILFLKFLICKEKFAAGKEGILFNEIADKIAAFSDSHAANKRELDRISGKFEEKGLSDYALMLKVLYARKALRPAGIEIAEEMKQRAEDSFGKGDFKKADAFYRHYFDIAGDNFDKDATAKSIAEVADKYFNKKEYGLALKYYRKYLDAYPDFEVGPDYCAYRVGQCLYFSKNYPDAIAQFNRFLHDYPGSKWFDGGFEHLSRLYYENPQRQKAIKDLEALIDTYEARAISQLAEFLIGFLYYDGAEYHRALEKFKGIRDDYPDSIYGYATETLINDIKNIDKGNPPAFRPSRDKIYHRWDPYMPIDGEIIAQVQVAAESTVKPGTRINFVLEEVKDFDKCEVYLYDAEDRSRFPRKMDDEIKEDLFTVTWSSKGGSFVDEKQGLKKVWQAPDEPGMCEISVRIDDLALIRPPDEGLKNDPEPLDLTVAIIVKE
ncbi:MAG: tetratricopeptide repeat protein [Candidatus Omnitrophota bacterium]|nr:MAG: tetratricopeptide repeat protein [Candidatus Omnitrophota bacterium]